MIAFCRWTADYYQAPLGEVLRAALPQGEQASAKRAVRLTELGRRALDRQGSLMADAARDPVLGALADAGGELPLARLFRLVPRARGPLPRLAEAGLVEMGDEVERRRPVPTLALAIATVGRLGQGAAQAGGGPAFDDGQDRGGRRRRSAGRVADGHRADAPAGAVDGGAGAGRAPAHRARAHGAGAAARIAPSAFTLNAAQTAAVAALARRARGRVRQLSPARRDRLREDGGLPAGHRGGARGRAGRAGAGARDRADAAAGVAVSGALRRGRGGAAQRAAAARAPRGLAAPARGRGRHRARRALGGVRAGAGARRGGRRRGARSLVQAGGGRALPRARSGAGARAARRRAGDPRLGHAVAGERAQRRARPVRAPVAPRAGDAAAAPGGDDRRPAPPSARPRRPALGAAVRGARRGAGRRRAEHPVPEPARFLDGDALPGLRPGGPLPELRRLDDLPPRPRAPLLPLLRRHHGGAGALPVVQLAADRAARHRDRAGRGDRARALSRRARGPARPRHGRQRRRRAISTPSCGGCRPARSISWSARRW